MIKILLGTLAHLIRLFCTIKNSDDFRIKLSTGKMFIIILFDPVHTLNKIEINHESFLILTYICIMSFSLNFFVFANKNNLLSIKINT